MWAGDQNVDFSMSDGIASTVVAALSMGMSGVGLTHFDIGGFTTFASYNPPLVRTEECLLRSAEMAVFTPVFRTHEGEKHQRSFLDFNCVCLRVYVCVCVYMYEFACVYLCIYVPVYTSRYVRLCVSE